MKMEQSPFDKSAASPDNNMRKYCWDTGDKKLIIKIHLVLWSL